MGLRQIIYEFIDALEPSISCTNIQDRLLYFAANKRNAADHLQKVDNKFHRYSSPYNI
jgi:hypothetical protein